MHKRGNKPYKEELIETTTANAELSKDNSISERRFVNDEEHRLRVIEKLRKYTENWSLIGFG